MNLVSLDKWLKPDEKPKQEKPPEKKKPPPIPKKKVEALIQLSMSHHARPKKEVEQEIASRIDHICERHNRLEPQSLENDRDAGKFAPMETFEEFKEW